MTTQPEALRLADVSRLSRHHEWHLQVDAELRRLAVVEAQRDALRAELKEATEAINDPAVNNLRTLPESIRVLCVQRDALLEALKSTGLFLHHCWCDVQMNDHSFEKLNRQMEIVDAAIKAVEGEKA